MGKQGLCEKYEVRNKKTEEIVEGCFVLRPDRDIAAFRALEAYAEETENRELACQIKDWLERLKEHYPNGAICSFCDNYTDKVRPSPYLAGPNAEICRHCWKLARERGNNLEGMDIGDFHDYPHWKGVSTVCEECKGEGYFSNDQGSDWIPCEKCLGEGAIKSEHSS